MGSAHFILLRCTSHFLTSAASWVTSSMEARGCPYIDIWCLHARHNGRNPSKISETSKYKGNVKKNEKCEISKFEKLNFLGVQNCLVERFCVFYERNNSLHDQYFEFRDFTFFVFLYFSFVFCSFANFGGISTFMASVEASDIEIWASASYHRRGYLRSRPG